MAPLLWFLLPLPEQVRCYFCAMWLRCCSRQHNRCEIFDGSTSMKSVEIDDINLWRYQDISDISSGPSNFPRRSQPSALNTHISLRLSCPQKVDCGDVTRATGCSCWIFWCDWITESSLVSSARYRERSWERPSHPIHISFFIFSYEDGKQFCTRAVCRGGVGEN